MQRVMRSNIDNSLVQVEDPEQILRERRRNMTEQGREVPRERDSDGKEYSKAEERSTPELYIPHLDNTKLITLNCHYRTSRSRKQANKKENKFTMHCAHSNHPLNLFLEKDSIFRSSGLELQLGHPIRCCLREISAKMLATNRKTRTTQNITPFNGPFGNLKFPIRANNVNVRPAH